MNPLSTLLRIFIAHIFSIIALWTAGEGSVINEKRLGLVCTAVTCNDSGRIFIKKGSFEDSFIA